jgi:hypothetical protein
MRNAGNCRSHWDAENLHTPRRWIRACLVIAAILSGGFGIIAVTGGNSVRTAVAASGEPAAYTAVEKGRERSGAYMAYRLVY